MGVTPRWLFPIAPLRKKPAHGRSIPGLASRSVLRASLRYMSHLDHTRYPTIHALSPTLGLPPKRAASLLLLTQLLSPTTSAHIDTEVPSYMEEAWKGLIPF